MNPICETEILFAPTDIAHRFLPEGPYPIDSQRISWVSIQHGATSKVGALNILDLKSKQNLAFDLPGRPGFAFPTDRDNVFVIGCEREIGYFDTQTRQWTPKITGVDANVSNTIINDGLVWDNNLIFGTKDLEFATKKARLYLLRGSDQKLISLRSDQICSNGKFIVSSIESQSKAVQLYDIDSPTRKIVRYELDVKSGTMSEATTIIDLTNDPTVPDGMTMTADGSKLIVSMYNPNPAEFGETRMYDIKSGDLVCVWSTSKSPRATCPVLVEFDQAVYLVITTAVEHMSSLEQAASTNAGCLFWARTDFKSAGTAQKFPFATLT